MATTIKCPHCHKNVQVDEALRHELEEKVLKESQEKHAAELKKLEEEFAKTKAELSEKARKAAIEKVRQEYDAKITSTKEEADEQAKRNQELQKQLTELLKQLRQAKSDQEKLEIEYQKKMLEEESKIKDNAKKEASEELNLKIAQKDKQLQDMAKKLQEAQRKAEQGSQQLQGEIFELELEELLKAEFPYDEIGEVPKGVRGADVIQSVCTRSGNNCGSIIWELKNTKNWSAGWVSKLKEDQRSLKAEIAILVSAVLPDGIESFGFYDGIWVSDLKHALSLAYALRQQLLKVHQTQLAHQGKATKAEVVYEYLISNEFKQRIEVWVEYFDQRRQDLEKEKKYFMKKWEKEEKEIFKVMQNTAGIYGDLQGLIGTALPKVQSLELPEEI